MQRDLRGNAKIAAVYTDRTENGRSNRVFGVDTHVPFGGVQLINLGTPRVRGVQASMWASGDIIFLNAGVFWRPTEQLRAGVTFNMQTVKRPSDETLVNGRYLPRGRLEYQLTRAMSIRWIAEYSVEKQSDLRDDSRTNLPRAVFDASTGTHRLLTAFDRRAFCSDFLFSWLPAPGTVFFAGYGSTEAENPAPRVGLERVRDGFFMKLSYLFRM